MSIFDSILSKLGINKPTAPAPAAPAAAPHVAADVAKAKSEDGSVVATPMRSASVPMVDVVAKLEAMAKKYPASNWKVSIADLLQLLGMDNSLNARKELATELGCPANLMSGDYSAMNMWLHKTVLQKLAENGGNIPASLLNK
jgi:hypothetical protein